MNQQNTDVPLGSAIWQGLFGLMRAVGFLVILVGFAAYASVTFHGVIPGEVAAQFRQNSPEVFGNWSDFSLKLFSAVVNPYGLRYLIAPLLATVTVMIAAAKYVMDLYNLDNFPAALSYIIASMFTIRYPRLVIDKGKVQLNPNETSPIEKIGGPGHVLVEPGSAAMFRHLRRPGQTLLASTYFLAPFEQIAFSADLEEQQCDKDEIRTVTQDGIQVMLRDVHLRYRILQKQRNGIPERRTIDVPYPLEQDAIGRMMKNLSVDKKGLDPWTVAVERYIVGEIMEFIASHPIDYLTAPRSDRINPRLELKADLFFRTMRNYLARNLGAELIWIDVGHIDIIEPSIDDQRTNLWAADWVGNANVERAYGEAKRAAYQELGRAEAQAELIMSISEALREANLTDKSEKNVRRLFLARTAQILDAMKQNLK